MKMNKFEYLKIILKKFKFNYMHLNFKDIYYLLDFYAYYSRIKKDCTLANEIWCLKAIFAIEKYYVEAFYKLKRDNFYGAWCTFGHVETIYKNLFKHYNSTLDEFKINSIYEYTKQFQKIFPYTLFSSVELKIDKFKCNICGKERISYKRVCNHKIGELYCGKLCAQIPEGITVINDSLVENPMDKCTVPFINGIDTYDYGKIKTLISALDSPFDDWNFEITETSKTHSEFKHISGDDSCPCGSGKIYSECCLNKDEIIIKHLEFYVNKPIEEIEKYNHYYINKKM